ncbi:MAG: hypothetical protein HY903_00495 [Deltaproteobacteria bacterium]|nr:hypothetical protein [Deltaproteobacteria bacterium]
MIEREWGSYGGIKVHARNVVYENSQGSRLEADNVQDALDELTVQLAHVIVGTWSVANYGYPPNDPGSVTFGGDGVYSVDGVFTAAGVTRPDVTATTYQAVANNLLILNTEAVGGTGTRMAHVAGLTPTELTLHAGGYASVLTKK